jgi:transcriptional regulator with XRE-family HTH domain
VQDPQVAEQFSAFLREARKRAGLSQEALAARAGLDRSAVGQLERGESSPRLATVIRLAGALGREPSDLIPAIRWTPSGSPAPEGTFTIG